MLNLRVVFSIDTLHGGSQEAGGTILMIPYCSASSRMLYIQYEYSGFMFNVLGGKVRRGQCQYFLNFLKYKFKGLMVNVRINFNLLISFSFIFLRLDVDQRVEKLLLRRIIHFTFRYFLHEPLSLQFRYF